MRSAALIASFVSSALVLSLHACSTRMVDRGGDSESHFLATCTEDTSCGAGLECLCGMCTRACSAASCGDLNPRAECVVAGACAGSGGKICDVSPADGSASVPMDSSTALPTDGSAVPREADLGSPKITDADGSTCTLATVPGRPSRSDSPGTRDIVVVAYSMDLGDSPTSLESPPTRYRSVGFDLDGLCSTGTSVDTTCLPRAEKQFVDGPGGIDNEFGVFVQFVRDRVSDFSSDTISGALAKGMRNWVFRIEGWNGGVEQDALTVDMFEAAPFDLAHGAGAVPRWDGNDVFSITSQSVLGGDLGRPKYRDAAAYVTEGRLVVTLPRAALPLSIPLTSRATVSLDVPVHGMELVCDLGTDATSLQCTVGARILVDDLIHQLSHFPDPLNTSGVAPLCVDTPSYETFKQSLCTLVDVPYDGLTTPAARCAALSIGMRFTARSALLGNVLDVPSGGELCASSSAPSFDSCDGGFQPPPTLDGG